jgi:hypothetical protein
MLPLQTAADAAADMVRRRGGGSKGMRPVGMAGGWSGRQHLHTTLRSRQASSPRCKARNSAVNKRNKMVLLANCSSARPLRVCVSCSHARRLWTGVGFARCKRGGGGAGGRGVAEEREAGKVWHPSNGFCRRKYLFLTTPYVCRELIKADALPPPEARQCCMYLDSL